MNKCNVTSLLAIVALRDKCNTFVIKRKIIICSSRNHPTVMYSKSPNCEIWKTTELKAMDRTEAGFPQFVPGRTQTATTQIVA